MPTCDQCQQTWSWRKTIRATTTLNPALTCPYCKETQYQTKSSRRNLSILPMITVAVPMLLTIFTDISQATALGLLFVFALATVLLSPILVEISSEEASFIN